MSTTTEEATVTLTQVNCGECGITFAMPDWYARERHADHRTFYCPNGHGRAWRGESREERLERELRNARSYGTSMRDQLEASERSRRAQKGVTTRMKNRIAAGVCPCCNRSFQDLRRHMAGQHPDFAHKEEQA